MAQNKIKLADTNTNTGTGAFVFDTSPTINSASLGASSVATTQSPGDNSTKLATTAYVANNLLSSGSYSACIYATTGALPAVVYNNGSSGVGATLTAVSFGAVSFDGSTPSVGDRILVKDQVSTFQNGIYTVTVVGAVATLFVLTRATDMNTSAEVMIGKSIFIVSGSTLMASTWNVNSVTSPTIGTDPITFAQTSGPGSFTPGTGIAIVGNTISINAGYIGQNSITTLGTVATGTWNATAIGVTKGGTGLATLTAHALIVGNGTSTPNFIAPSTSGNILTSNGTDWVSSAQSFIGLPDMWGGDDINTGIGNNTYTIILYAAFGMTINELKIVSNSGTCTAAIKINGTSVTGISAVSVSSTIATGTATALNTVSVGQKITLVLSSTSSLNNLQWTLKTTRT